jgi:hypothetical protein
VNGWCTGARAISPGARLPELYFPVGIRNQAMHTVPAYSGCRIGDLVNPGQDALHLPVQQAAYTIWYELESRD